MPALGKQQQDYEFNIAKVTEIRNFALLCLSLSVPSYTPSHSFILNQILQPLDQSFHQVFKFIHSDFAIIFRIFFLFFFYFCIVDKSVVTGNVCKNQSW